MEPTDVRFVTMVFNFSENSQKIVIMSHAWYKIDKYINYDVYLTDGAKKMYEY